jgi:hypothetical protein
MEFTIAMVAGTVAIATTVALVWSENKRAEADRALGIAIARLAACERGTADALVRAVKAELKLANAQAHIDEQELIIDELWKKLHWSKESADLGWSYVEAFKTFVITKCLVQRPTKGRRWFCRVDRVKLKSAIVAQLRYDPRFESWEHELWGEDMP